MSVNKKIYNAIVGEKWLHDADGGHVSEAWVSRRYKFYMLNGNKEIICFRLFDIRKEDSCIYLHMVWVRKDYRGNGLAQRSLDEVIKLAKKEKIKLIFCYANKNGQAVLKKNGFSIGKIKYRECMYYLEDSK